MSTITHSIMLALVVSAIPAFAAEDTSSALRSELDALNERLAELEKNSEAESKPDWTDRIKIKGDLRYRFELVKEDDDTSKNRQRIRARLGAYAEVNDFTTAGIRIRTGGDANSGNETIGNNFDNKDVYLDLAYITMAPEDAKYGEATVGKMKYPWKVTTDLIWDGDVNPEGIAYTYLSEVDKTGLFASTGYFKVQETSSTHDLNLASAQAGVTQPLGEKSKLTVGCSYFDYDNIEDFIDPDTGANYLVDYDVAEAFTEVSFKDVLPVPLKLYGNYVNNLEESSDNEGYCAGIKFGDAKKGKWEAKIGYRDLDVYAAPAYYADSDFAGGGTDVKGARVKAKYNIAKHLQAAATFIAGEQKSSGTDVNTVHLDLIASF